MTAWTDLRDAVAADRDSDLALLLVDTPTWLADDAPAARPATLVAASETFALRAVLDGPDIVREAGAVLAPLVAGVAAGVDPAPAPPLLDHLAVLALESSLACVGVAPDDPARAPRWLAAYAGAALDPLLLQNALVAAAGSGARDAGARLAATRGTPPPGSVEDLAVLLLTTAEPEPALSAWRDFRDAFPRMHLDGLVSWGELLWLARGALHHLGGVPLGSVVTTLRAEVLP